MEWFILFILIPPVLTAVSQRVEGESKRKWVLISLIFSWFGYIAFLLMAGKHKDDKA